MHTASLPAYIQTYTMFSFVYFVGCNAFRICVYAFLGADQTDLHPPHHLCHLPTLTDSDTATLTLSNMHITNVTVIYLSKIPDAPFFNRFSAAIFNNTI